MAIFISVFALLFISSITFMPSLLELVSDKSNFGYLLLSAFFNPIFDGIMLIISVVITLFSRKGGT